MPSSVDKINEFIELITEGHGKVNEAFDVLSGGPASYYFDKLNGYLDALFNKYAPFRVGDIVVLKKTYKVTSAACGWEGSKHFLVKGSRAEVRHVDYCSKKGCFTADLIFDDDSWIDGKGKKRPIKREDRGTFHFTEEYIRKVS